MIEQWKRLTDKVLGKYYLASNMGRIRSIKRNKFLVPCLNKKRGYVYVSCQHKGHRRNYILHRIIAELFVPNVRPEVDVCVDHKDFDKENNRSDNLEWVTHAENTRRAIEGGRISHTIGERSTSPLKEFEVIEMFSMHKRGSDHREIADRFNVRRCTISLILNGHRWNHIYKQYK